MKLNHQINFHAITLVFFALFSFPSIIAATTLDKLISSHSPPSGIVFEIVEDEPEALGPAVEWVNRQITRLRKQFPKLEFAVVSHGPELFALQKENRPQFEQLHTTVRNLSNANIDVHVCETFAGWHDVTADQFPDYVDVAPTGPAQIRSYEALGYLRIRVVDEMN